MKTLTSYLLLWAALLPAAAVEAAQNGLPALGEGQATSAAAPQVQSSAMDSQADGNDGVIRKPRGNSRYGIGYEARHGAHHGNSAGMLRNREGRDNERLERPERMERAERIERGGRGH